VIGDVGRGWNYLKMLNNIQGYNFIPFQRIESLCQVVD
jgi:hypothetical protein